MPISSALGSSALLPAGLGFRNVLINGDFKVWQRGTSFAAPANVAYTADRWSAIWGTAQRTYSRQTGFSNAQYCLRIARDSGSTDTGNNGIAQAMETVNTVPLQSKTMTLSFNARCGANYSASSSQLGVYVYTGTGTDQSVATWYSPGWTGSANPLSSTATLTTTAQKFTYSFLMPATATQTIVYFNSSCTGTAGAADYYEITNVQLEQNYQPTPFEQRPYGTELALCQRYYAYMDYTVGGTGANFVDGYQINTAYITSWFKFPQTMRIRPTSVVLNIGGNVNTQGWTAAAVGPDYIQVYANPIATGRGYYYVSNLAGSAEL